MESILKISPGLVKEIFMDNALPIDHKILNPCSSSMITNLKYLSWFVQVTSISNHMARECVHHSIAKKYRNYELKTKILAFTCMQIDLGLITCPHTYKIKIRNGERPSPRHACQVGPASRRPLGQAWNCWGRTSA